MPVPLGTPRGEPMSRRGRGQREEPGGTTTGMLHRRPDRDCPLCGLWGRAWVAEDPSTHGAQHEDAARLWAAWDGRSGAATRVVGVLRQMGVAADERAVRAHYRHHRVEQPMPASPVSRASAMLAVERLSARKRQIVDTVYRMRVLSGDQIQRLWYGDDLSARARASQELHALTHAHLLYRYWVDDIDRVGAQAVYFTGRDAAPWLERHHGQDASKHVVIRSRDVKERFLRHDLRVAELFCRWSADASAPGPDGPPRPMQLLKANWYGPRHLVLGYRGVQDQADRALYADGFCAPSWPYLPGQEWPGGTFPMVYEYDSGERDLKLLIDQLEAYVWMNRSGALTKRFPQAAIGSYRPPTVMVCADGQGQIKDLDARMRRACVLLQRRMSAWGVTVSLPPLLLVSYESCMAEGLAAPTRYAWDRQDRTAPLGQLLCRLGREAAASRRLPPGITLDVDLQAARPLTYQPD